MLSPGIQKNAGNRNYHVIPSLPQRRVIKQDIYVCTENISVQMIFLSLCIIHKIS